MTNQENVKVAIEKLTQNLADTENPCYSIKALERARALARQMDVDRRKVEEQTRFVRFVG